MNIDNATRARMRRFMESGIEPGPASASCWRSYKAIREYKHQPVEPTAEEINIEFLYLRRDVVVECYRREDWKEHNNGNRSS